MTVGIFDGVHLAHRLILDELKHKAQEHSAKSVVVTFDKHPCEVIAPERYGKEVFLLTTLDEKLELFREIGINYVVVLPFTKEFAGLSYSDFIENMLVKYIRPKLVFVGFNHNFGKDRSGNFEKLQELAKKHGFQAEIFQEKYFDGHKVSSSEIRRLIRAGEVERANQLLGRHPERSQGIPLMQGDVSTTLCSAQHNGVIAESLKHVRQQIPKCVKLVAVSKTKPITDLEEAYVAGQRDFGENKVQELIQKQPHLPNDIRWHFIGHLQTNKVKFIAPFVHLIHGVDSLKLLKEIDKQAQKNNRIIDCLLEFHIAEEESKFGLNLQDAEQILSEIRRGVLHTPQPTIATNANGGVCNTPLQNVRICGVMGMATFTDNRDQIRREFQNLHQIFQILKEKYFADQSHFCEISMGMSDDFQIAIEEGSTMVRIGSTIFGSR